MAVDALSSNPPKDVDENEFIDASRLVYDGVREIRRAVLMNRVTNVLNVVKPVRFYYICTLSFPIYDYIDSIIRTGLYFIF